MNVKEFYNTNKKAVIAGSIVLAFLAVFIFGWVSGTRGGVSMQYNAGFSGIAAPAIMEKTMSVGRSAAVADSVGGSQIIIPPTPEVPASGPLDSSIERKVIKNASVDMVVKNTERSAEDVKNVASANGGFVGSATVWEEGNEKRGAITIRVPAEAFDAALKAIKELAVKVTREDINAQDVTEEFVDLEAQLKNYKAAEQQYLQVLTRASTVEDILAVRRELDRVRSDIERLQGRINYLSRQIGMSTISVSLTSEAEVKVFGIVWSPWNQIKQGFRTMLADAVGFVNLLIAFAFKLPVFALWIAVIATVVWGGRKGVIMIKRKYFLTIIK